MSRWLPRRRCRPDVRVVPQQGTGKGSALRTGFLAATGDIIVMMDADGSMSPQRDPPLSAFPCQWLRLRQRVAVHQRRGVVGHHLVPAARQPVPARGVQLALPQPPDRLELRILRIRPSLSRAPPPVGHRLRNRGRDDRAGHAGGVCASPRFPASSCLAGSGESNLHAIRDGIRVLRTVLRHHRSGVSGHLYQAVRQVAGRPAAAMSAKVTA